MSKTPQAVEKVVVGLVGGLQTNPNTTKTSPEYSRNGVLRLGIGLRKGHERGFSTRWEVFGTLLSALFKARIPAYEIVSKLIAKSKLQNSTNSMSFGASVSWETR